MAACCESHRVRKSQLVTVVYPDSIAVNTSSDPPQQYCVTVDAVKEMTAQCISKSDHHCREEVRVCGLADLPVLSLSEQVARRCLGGPRLPPLFKQTVSDDRTKPIL